MNDFWIAGSRWFATCGALPLKPLAAVLFWEPPVREIACLLANHACVEKVSGCSQEAVLSDSRICAAVFWGRGAGGSRFNILMM